MKLEHQAKFKVKLKNKCLLLVKERLPKSNQKFKKLLNSQKSSNKSE